MIKKRLAVLVLMGLAASVVGGFTVKASDSTTLNEVVVNADKNRSRGNETVIKPLGVVADQVQEVGLLGEKDVLDTPFSSMTLTRKDLDYFGSPAKGPTDVITLNPAVRDNSSSLYNDISIRGLKINGHSMFLNGIPDMLDQQHATDVYIDKTVVIAGPNLGITGTPAHSAAAGTVDFISKRAQDKENLDLTLSYLGGESTREIVDFGKRFGDNKRWGVRVMSDFQDGETAISNEKIRQKDVFVNIDQKTTSSKTNLLVGYNYVDQHASPHTFSFASDLSKIPKAPSASHSYKPSWSYNEFDNWIATLNHEQKLNDHVTAYVNAGYHREDWYGYIDGSPKILNANGDYTITETNYPLAVTSKYVGVGIKGDFDWGATKHNYVVNFDRTWYYNYGGEDKNWGNNGSVIVTGNVYSRILNDLAWKNANKHEGTAPWSQSQRINGWHIADTISMMNGKLDVLLGLHGHDAKQTKSSGTKTYTGVNPTFGVNYKITPNFSVYASHSESFMLGTVVGAGYLNAGKALDPAKTKQNEFGFKYKTGDLLHTLAFYQLKQPNYYGVKGENYGTDGYQNDKGFEYSISGSLNDKLDIIGGFSYIDAKQPINKKRVNGVPRWASTLGLVYKPTDSLSLIGRFNYMSRASIMNEKLETPSFVTFDFGANYEAYISNTPVTFKAMLYNVFGRDYWMGMNGSNSVLLGQPRTFVLSATMHL